MDSNQAGLTATANDGSNPTLPVPDDKRDFAIVVVDPHGDLTLNVGTLKEDGRAATQFLVCSRALARASPVFERMLYGSLAEANCRASDDWTVNLPEDNAPSFELFAWISHSIIRKTSTQISLQSLSDLTILTHYYDATEALAPWVDRWLASISKPSIDNELGMFRILWTCQELGKKRTFESTARAILLDCTPSIDRDELHKHLGGHLSNIILRIDAIRDQTTRAMLDVFQELTDILVVVDEKPRWCSYATYMGPHRCESMILGSMVFCLTRASLWPIPEVCDVDHSVMSLYRQLVDIVIHDIGQPEKDKDHAKCNPRNFVLGRLQRILDDMADPLLEVEKDYVLSQGGKLALS